MEQYLARFREDVPDWLANYNPGDPFPVREALGSRIVFYPGSEFDGQPVKLFGSTHTAHVFFYVDYAVSKERITEELDGRYRFRGYHTLARIDLAEQDLIEQQWCPHVHPDELRPNMYWFSEGRDFAPFGFVEILERNDGFGDDHGAKRLAILFLGADGIAAYDALFCQRHSVRNPYIVVVQDHGFGGNYDRFGSQGLLSRIAGRCRTWPEWLLIGEPVHPWNGFVQVPDVEHTEGGWGRFKRYLFSRDVLA
jgi:hypothetical protein